MLADTKSEVLSENDTRKTYQKATDAVQDYNKALKSGDDSKIKETKENLESIKEETSEIEKKISGSDEVFNEIYDGINKADEAAYKLDDGFKNNDSVKQYAEQLRGFTSDDLSKINFEDNVKSPAEESFGLLRKELNLSEDELESLIDKLVELGYVEGNLKDQTDLPSSTPFTKKNWDAISDLPDDDTNKPIKEAQSALQELAKQGKLTIDAFNKTDGSDSILSHFGLEADEAVEKINKLIENTKQLNAMRTGITNITTNYDTKKKHKKLSASDLDSTYDTLGISEWKGSDKKVWEDYKHAAEDTSIGLGEFKKKQDALATSFVNSNNFLSHLTKKNEDYYKTLLSEMGVENADSVIKQALIKSGQNLSVVTKELGISSEKLSSLSLEEANKLNGLADASEEAKQSLYYYMLQKTKTNQIKLTTSSECDQLYNLAKQAGIATSKLRELLNAQIQLKTAEQTQLKIDAINNGLNRSKDGTVTYINPINGETVTQKEKSAYSTLSGLTKLKNKELKLAEKNIEKYKVSADDLETLSTTRGNKSNDAKKDKDKDKDKSKSKTEYDWIKTKLEHVADLAAKAQNAINRMLNISSKDSKTRKALNAVTKELQMNEKAAKRYMQRANKTKLDPYYRHLVQVGKIGGKKDIQSITSDSKLQKRIEKYKTLYDNAKSCRDQMENLVKTIQDLSQSLASLPIEKADEKIEKLDKSSSLANAKAENRFTAREKNAQIDIEIGNLDKSTKASKEAYDKTQGNLNKGSSTALKASYKGLKKADRNKIKSLIKAKKPITDSLLEKVRKNGSAQLYKKLSNYNAFLDANDTAGYNYNLAQEENETEKRNNRIEQHQNFADEHQTALDNLSAQKELTATASEKNAIIEQEKAVTASLYGEKIAIAQLNGDAVEAAKLQYELQKQQRDLAVEQHQNLADEYQANIDLSQAEQDRTKTAKDKNSMINSEAEQTKRLYGEKIAIAQLEGNAVEAQKLQIELQGELLALEQKKFDNISQYYDNIRTNTDNTLSDLDNQIAQMEARGITASAGLYKSKLETENKLRDILEAKRTELEEEHKAMEEETPEWYSQKKAIQEVENQISKCTQNMSGYLSSIREAKNELRELYKTVENINNGAVGNASSYLSRYELTDDDIGGLTEKGIAQLGIYGSQIENAKANQQTDMERLSELAGILNGYGKAWDGAKQIQYLGQFNFGSIEDVVKEYNEYSEKVQSDISERISGEENIISLMKERYDSELAFIKKLVDARKTLLSEEKDLYDFQKNVRDKVENISSLEKQIAALSGDGSEEAKMKRQQLQSQLDDAKEDLMDVEYDRYISDQTTMLDDLYEKYEAAIGDMLKDVDTLLNDGNEIARENGEKLQSILDNFVEKYNDPTTDTKEIVKKMEDGSPLPSNVANTKTNTDAIKEMLQQEQSDNDAAQAVMSLINAIGEIGYNPESMNSIYNARTAYDALTTQQKAIVDANGGLKTLNQKETDFNNSVAKYNDDVKRQQEAEQAQAQLQAQQAEEAKKAEKRNAFEQMIKETYQRDAGRYGQKLRWGTEKLGDGDYGTVQKKIHDMGISRVDKPYVNANWIKEACNRLGYSRPESQNAGTLLNYMNSIGYSSGGVVDNLVKVPGRNGDDGWGTLKLGEYVLKPLDSSTFQDFVGKMEPFNLMMDHMMENVTKNIPAPVPTLASQLTPVEIGDINITLDGTNVVDKDSLIRTMQTDRKTQQVMKEVVWDKIAGRGSLNVRRL